MSIIIEQLDGKSFLRLGSILLGWTYVKLTKLLPYQRKGVEQALTNKFIATNGCKVFVNEIETRDLLKLFLEWEFAPNSQ
jgi:hypothetical protein